jgi:SAM-dependent methyltransferase
MTLVFRLLRRTGARRLDPLQVAMTGVRMGERVLQIGCSDRALLPGLAAKVGLSGAAAVVAFNDVTAERARALGAKAGALVDVQLCRPGAPLPFADESFDMVVVDDTAGDFRGLAAEDRVSCLSDARRVVRTGGRLEAIEGVGGGGWLGAGRARPTDRDASREIAAAGFAPVRVLAETGGFRFVEGLKTAVGSGEAPDKEHRPDSEGV